MCDCICLYVFVSVCICVCAFAGVLCKISSALSAQHAFRFPVPTGKRGVSFCESWCLWRLPSRFLISNLQHGTISQTLRFIPLISRLLCPRWNLCGLLAPAQTLEAVIIVNLQKLCDFQDRKSLKQRSYRERFLSDGWSFWRWRLPDWYKEVVDKV